MSPILVFAAISSLVTVPGPNGKLEGTLVNAGAKAPIAVIIPGSGPTDRDGNNPLGVTAAPYRLLADALAERGVSTIRADKRGLFGSKSAIPDANKVTIADYAADAHRWAALARTTSGNRCAWLLGHSEGALIALAAAQTPEGLCGVILVAAPGRKLGDVLREQLRANLANVPVLASALAAIDSLEAGKLVDTADMNPALLPLFAPQVQPFLIDLMSKDPALLASRIRAPILIIQGGRDLQVSPADAERLHKAQPTSRLSLFPEMNHVLKRVATDDRAANLAAYSNSALPIEPGLADAIAEFVKRP
jgi:pimeloyl-ACP methyl ester carboxylesterase